jgi:hypothetical protein
MNERIVRLRTHQKNVERYQSLLETKLDDLEVQFLDKRLSEERLAIAILQTMGPGSAAKRDDHPDLDGQKGFEQLPLHTPGKPPQ